MMLDEQTDPGFVPTYATFDPANKDVNITLSNGNKTATRVVTNGHKTVYLNTRKTSGKWAFEFTIGTGGNYVVGLQITPDVTTFIGNYAGCGWYGATGAKYTDGFAASAYWDAGVTGTTYLMLLDMDAKTFSLIKSGVMKASQVLTAYTNPYIGLSMGSMNYTIQLNTGQAPFVNDAMIPVGYNKGLWL